MKRKLISLILLAIVLACHAQSQQGYVKTRGRLGSNGTVIKGTRLAGAMVTVKGRNGVISNNNGAFKLVIPGNNYYLQNVVKQGYVICDPDILSRQYTYSKNALVLVLEDQEQQTDEILKMQGRIRRNLQRQLQQREDEIEALKEENKITKQEYQQRLQKLYADQENNDKLIQEMADRYAKIDYDQVDEFNKTVSQYILEGELVKADSLLKTKGDINVRTAELQQLQEQNAKDEEELSIRKKKLEKNKALAEKELNSIAQDCYSKYEIFKLQHQNDSAAYYIDLRASLDTTNIEWALAAGKFYQKYLASYSKAEEFFARCLRIALASGKEDFLPECYGALGSVYSNKGELDRALEFYQKVVEICKSLYGEEHQFILSSLINLANVYRKKADYEKATELCSKGIDVMNRIEDLSVSTKVKVYGNIANLYCSQNKYQKALEYYLISYELLDSCQEKLPLESITLYSNIGQIYYQLGDDDKALAYDQKSYELIVKVLGDSHPEMATLLNNMGAVYLRQKKHNKALEVMRRSLDISTKLHGRQSPNLIVDYNNLGMIQYAMGLNEDALETYRISLDLCTKHLPQGHPFYASIYNNIGSAYLKSEKKETIALDYFEKALKIRIDKYGENNASVAIVYYNMGMCYQHQGKLEEAIKYLEKSKAIFSSTLGPEHPRTKQAEKNIAKIKDQQ